MPNYMTFIFDATSIRALLDKNPDYLLMNVGSRIITDPENPEKGLAVLTVDAQSFKNGTIEPMAMTAGCPIYHHASPQADKNIEGSSGQMEEIDGNKVLK